MAKNHRPFDEVLQFPDITRPVIADQSVHCLRWNFIDPLIHPLGVKLQEVVYQSRNIFRTLAQRWNMDWEYFQPVVKIVAKGRLPHHRGQIAMCSCDQTDIHLMRAIATESSNSCSWSTRNSLAWSSNGISPTSSRKRVPLWASSKRPVFWATAPVKAPLSCPNNSLSRSPRGIAAQFNLMKERPWRTLKSWIARAISSFPVPVSPNIKVLESVGATMETSSRAVLNAGLSPTISPNSARISPSR